eukprot:250085-Pyramimonas_sp.AAC.1
MSTAPCAVKLAHRSSGGRAHVPERDEGAELDSRGDLKRGGLAKQLSMQLVLHATKETQRQS